MKKLFVFILLLVFATSAFSQNSFTTATLQEVLDSYKNNSKKFFNERLSADFRYINTEGQFNSRDSIVIRDAQKIISTEIFQPVIFQSGDLAVVSGIHRTIRTEKDGKQTTTQVACTYTFQRRDNKWMFVASQQTSLPNP